MKKALFLIVFLLGVFCLNAQSVENVISGNIISESEIDNSIRDLLGNDFSTVLNNAGVDIGAIIKEEAKRQAVKAGASLAVSSVAAVKIMELYEEAQRSSLASSISDVRNSLNDESQKLLRLQQNLIRLKMQNKMGGSSLPNYRVMETIRVKDLANATNADRRINDLLTKSGVGTSLSVYDRLKLSDKVNKSIQNKVANNVANQILKSSDSQLEGKIRTRAIKTKMIISNTEIIK